MSLIDDTTSVDAVRLSRESISLLQEQIRRLEEELVSQRQLTELAREEAEKATAALDTVFDVLNEEGLTVTELQMVVARARANTDPEAVMQSFPDHLKIIFSGLDAQLPELAKISLSRLRPGSVRLLETYGICSFAAPGPDGAMVVTLTDRVWPLVKLAQAWAAEQD